LFGEFFDFGFLFSGDFGEFVEDGDSPGGELVEVLGIYDSGGLGLAVDEGEVFEFFGVAGGEVPQGAEFGADDSGSGSEVEEGLAGLLNVF
jgi:hypothetical protein